VAAQLDIDTRTLTPVDVFHFIPRHREFRSANASLSISQMGYTPILPKVISANGWREERFLTKMKGQIACEGVRQLPYGYCDRVNSHVYYIIFAAISAFARERRYSVKLLIINGLA
jgi:hypothetical protein